MQAVASKTVYLCAVSILVLSVPAAVAIPPKGAERNVDRGIARSTTALLPQPESVRPATLGGLTYDAFGVTLLSNVPLADFPSGSNAANDVWGYVSPSGREYAIIGLNKGTGFVDISDPTDPHVIADIPDAQSIWSDMAVYGEYAYNVNENSGGMQVIDLTQIDGGIVTLVGALTSNGFDAAHNVFVNADSGYAYLCGANSPARGLVAVDLSDPADPTMVGLWSGSYAHDVFVQSYGDCPYDGRSGPCEIAFVFAGGVGFKIVDVTDKSNMTTIASLGYENLDYCHQGWLTPDLRHIIMGDEGDELSFGLTTTTYVINVEDVANPQYVTAFGNGLPAIDHNLIIRGKYAFEANYTTGLRIWDISDVNNATEVGYFDTFPYYDFRNYAGAWGVYPNFPSGVVLISDGTGGLFVLDASEATVCTTDAQCNDRDPCTADACGAGGECTSVPLTPGSPCDDGEVCSINGACDASGDCVSTHINTISCSDDGPCAPGECDLDSGLCVCAPCVFVDRPTEELVQISYNQVGPLTMPRHLTFTPAGSSELTALRVTFLDLPAPFEDFENQSMWVSQPVELCENSGETTPPPDGCGSAPGLPSRTYLSAVLSCQPHFADWGQVGLLSVYGDAIVPGGRYGVQAIAIGCYAADEPRYSIPLNVETSVWGDVVKNCVETPCSPPDGIIDVTTDVTAVLDKFKNARGAVRKVRADLEPTVPDQKINITDVTYCLDAFSGATYSFAGPQGCP